MRDQDVAPVAEKPCAEAHRGFFRKVAGVLTNALDRYTN